MYHPVRDFITDSAFSRTFSHDPRTFATNPRVVESVTGSVLVGLLLYEYFHLQVLASFNSFDKIGRLLQSGGYWMKCIFSVLCYCGTVKITLKLLLIYCISTYKGALPIKRPLTWGIVTTDVFYYIPN